MNQNVIVGVILIAFVILQRLNRRRGKPYRVPKNLIPNKMTDTEKAQFRMGCLIEAGKIKQSLNAHPEVESTYKNKDVVVIAKEFSAFVLAEE